MFPFILDDSFELALPHKTDGEIMEAIRQALVAKRAKHIRCAGNRIGFRGGQFRAVGRGNPLSSITNGTITIERQAGDVVKVRYHLTFWELFVTTMVMIALFFGLFIAQHFPSTPNEKMFILLGMVSWMYGGNLVITRIQFPWFLENAIAPVSLPGKRNP